MTDRTESPAARGPERAIDVDGYLAADQSFRCTLRRGRRVPHTGPTLVVLTETEARALVAELQAALAELTWSCAR